MARSGSNPDQIRELCVLQSLSSCQYFDEPLNGARRVVAVIVVKELGLYAKLNVAANRRKVTARVEMLRKWNKPEVFGDAISRRHECLLAPGAGYSARKLAAVSQCEAKRKVPPLRRDAATGRATRKKSEGLRHAPAVRSGAIS